MMPDIRLQALLFAITFGFVLILGGSPYSRVSVPISDIYFLRYAPRCFATHIVKFSAGQAVMELLRNSLSLYESRHAKIARLCRLAGRVQAHILHYSSAQKAVRVIAERLASA